MNGLQLAVNDPRNAKLMGNNLNHKRNVKSMRYISIFCKTVVLFISLYQTLFKYCNIRTCETQPPRKAYQLPAGQSDLPTPKSEKKYSSKNLKHNFRLWVNSKLKICCAPISRQ